MPDTPALQFLGLCRFSVPSIGGFQTEHATLDERRAMLYAPARLDQRLAWFEHALLPGIRRQTDGDFRLVVLIGEDLPEPWCGRLRALVAEIPQIVLEAAPPGPHRKICADAMRPHVLPGTQVLAQFRLDDDDAVAPGFIARARRDVGAALGILEDSRMFALDYGRGLVLRWTGTAFEILPQLTRLWTPALLFVTRPSLDRFILNTRHDTMWKYMPVVSHPDEVMFVRGEHATNDSKVSHSGAFDLPQGRRDWLIGHKFGIDLPAFARRLQGAAAPAKPVLAKPVPGGRCAVTRTPGNEAIRMTARSDNTLGSLYMMGSMLAFLINDTLMKMILADAPLFQAITLRGAGTTLLFLGFVFVSRNTRARIARRDRGLIAVRSIADGASTVLYLAGLFYLPIANATAILLALPLTVSLAGAVFLGEPLGWRRLTAIFLGFVGVLLIVRPGLAGFNVYSLFILASVLTVTVREIMTRQLSPGVPSVRVALAGVATGTLAGVAGMFSESWQPLPLHTWLELAAAVLFVLAGYLLSVKAMRVGDIAFVTPYRYTSLIFALISGVVVFGDWPDNITLLGAAIIVATGLFTLFREGRAARARAPAPVPAVPSAAPPG